MPILRWKTILANSNLMNWKINSYGRNVKTIDKHINNASKEEVIIQLSQILRQLLQMKKRYLLNIYNTCNIINLNLWRRKCWKLIFMMR